MGRGDGLRDGDWNAMCWQCGRKRKAGDLMKYWQGFWTCPEHWETRQPQDFARGVEDVQTPPWVQPMADYSFGTARRGANGAIVMYSSPETIVIEAEQDGAEFTFTPDFTFTLTEGSTVGEGTIVVVGTGASGGSEESVQYFLTLTITSSDGAYPIGTELGPFPLGADLTSGEEVTLTLEAIPGTGNANGIGARYQWVAFQTCIALDARGLYITAPTESGSPAYKIIFFNIDTEISTTILETEDSLSTSNGICSTPDGGFIVVAFVSGETGYRLKRYSRCGVLVAQSDELLTVFGALGMSGDDTLVAVNENGNTAVSYLRFDEELVLLTQSAVYNNNSVDAAAYEEPGFTVGSVDAEGAALARVLGNYGFILFLATYSDGMTSYQIWFAVDESSATVVIENPAAETYGGQECGAAYGGGTGLIANNSDQIQEVGGGLIAASFPTDPTYCMDLTPTGELLMEATENNSGDPDVEVSIVVREYPGLGAVFSGSVVLTGCTNMDCFCAKGVVT